MYLTFGTRENHVIYSYHTFTQKAKKHKETWGEDVWMYYLDCGYYIMGPHVCPDTWTYIC